MLAQGVSNDQGCYFLITSTYFAKYCLWLLSWRDTSGELGALTVKPNMRHGHVSGKS